MQEREKAIRPEKGKYRLMQREVKGNQALESLREREREVIKERAMGAYLNQGKEDDAIQRLRYHRIHTSCRYRIAKEDLCLVRLRRRKLRRRGGSEGRRGGTGT